MNKDKDLIGQPGIDTSYERDKLNYRPDLKWERPEINSEWREQTTSTEFEQLNNLTRVATLDLWNNFLAIIKKLKELDEELSKKLHNTFADIPEDMQKDVQMAANKYGFSVVDKIPFELYKVALHAKDSLEKQLIVDVYEDFHADVYGDILAELYPDVAEMQQDWQDAFHFLNRGVFAQLVNVSDLPKEATEEDKSIQKIVAEERLLGDKYKVLAQEIEASNEFLRISFLHSAPEEQLSAIQRDIAKIQKTFNDLERRIHTKRESVDLSESKVRRATTNLEVMRYAIDLDQYKGERKGILISLLKPYLTGQPIEKGLRKIQALLKLSVDGKNSLITDTKMNLRNLSGRENRKRINGALVNGIHLRNEVSGEVLDIMSNVEDNPDLLSFNKVAAHIMDSVSVSRDLFKDNASDFYKMHTMESELRLDKISSLIDKDSAREIYKLLDSLIMYAQEKNNWPTERDLITWIDNFLTSQKLS